MILDDDTATPPPGHDPSGHHPLPEPSAGTPGQIILHASFLPLAFLLAFCRLTVTVGSTTTNARWGRTPIPVPPGHHPVRVHVNYLGRLGPAEDVVPVRPGESVDVHYRAPAFMFIKGAIGPDRPATPGIWLVVAMVVCALLLVIPVMVFAAVFSASITATGASAPAPPPAAQSTAAPSPATSEPPTAESDTGLDPYLGSWKRVDGSLTVNPEGTAIRSREVPGDACGAPEPCRVHGMMILTPGEDGESYIGTFIDAWYTSGDQILATVPAELREKYFVADDRIYLSLSQFGHLYIRPLDRLFDMVDLTDRSGTGPPDGIVDFAWAYCDDRTSSEYIYQCNVPSPPR